MQNIILAAGLGSRSDGKKLLLPYKGEPIVTHAVRASLEAGLQTIVVTGHNHEAVHRLLDGLACSLLKIKYNDQYQKGQGSSTLCGVSQLDPTQSFFISLADMPFIESHHYQFLMNYTGHAVIRPQYEGRLGHPVMLEPAFIPIIQSQPVQFTMRSLLSNYPVHAVAVTDKAYILDIDTLQEYRMLINSELPPLQNL